MIQYPTSERIQTGDHVAWSQLGHDYTGTVTGLHQEFRRGNPITLIYTRIMTGPGNAAGMVTKTNPVNLKLLNRAIPKG
jgi:hypothetical protein